MRIKSIYVNNFKSLVDFKIDLAKFNCLIGLNGSGKSTFLQFMDFLAQLMKPNGISRWLKNQKWDIQDVCTKLREHKKVNGKIEIYSDIEFYLEFEHENQCGYWKGKLRPYSSIHNEPINRYRCIEETLNYSESRLTTKKELFEINSPDEKLDLKQNILFQYEGSILSQLEEKQIPTPFLKLKLFFDEINSFSPLSPDIMRTKNENSDRRLGIHGENFTAFFHDIGDEKRKIIVHKLQAIIPSIANIETIKLPSGNESQLRELIMLRETYTGCGFFIDHINDGLLRLLAILAQLEMEQQFLLFDEIENGINPELVDFLLKEFLNAKQQIVVTTHSPLFLNYLEDETAKESVKYFYKTSEGYSKCIPFFEIPSIQEKLGVLGPGEAFADTDLFGLAREIERITASSEKGE